MRGPGALDSFGNILSGLAKRLGLESRLLELRLQHHWHDLVGEPTASHTWPAQIRFKKLYLVVRNSVWLQQLTFLKPALLTKLQAEIGAGSITDLAFRVGEIPDAAETTPTPFSLGAEPHQPEEPSAEVVSHTEVIQDPALREQFRAVISQYPAPVPPQPVRGPSPTP